MILDDVEMILDDVGYTTRPAAGFLILRFKVRNVRISHPYRIF